MHAYFMLYNTASHNTIIQVSAGFHPVGEGVGGGGDRLETGEKLPKLPSFPPYGLIKLSIIISQ